MTNPWPRQGSLWAAMTSMASGAALMGEGMAPGAMISSWRILFLLGDGEDHGNCYKWNTATSWGDSWFILLVIRVYIYIYIYTNVCVCAFIRLDWLKRTFGGTQLVLHSFKRTTTPVLVGEPSPLPGWWVKKCYIKWFALVAGHSV